MPKIAVLRDGDLDTIVTVDDRTTVSSQNLSQFFRDTAKILYRGMGFMTVPSGIPTDCYRDTEEGLTRRFSGSYTGISPGRRTLVANQVLLPVLGGRTCGLFRASSRRRFYRLPGAYIDRKSTSDTGAWPFVDTIPESAGSLSSRRAVTGRGWALANPRLFVPGSLDLRGWRSSL